MKLQLVMTMIHLTSTGSYLLGLRPFYPEREDTTEDMIRAQVMPMVESSEASGMKVPRETVDKFVGALVGSVQRMRALNPETSYPLPTIMTVEVPQQEHEKRGNPNVGAVLDLSMEPAKKMERWRAYSRFRANSNGSSSDWMTTSCCS